MKNGGGVLKETYKWEKNNPCPSHICLRAINMFFLKKFIFYIQDKLNLFILIPYPEGLPHNFLILHFL